VYAKIFTSIFDGSMRGHPDLILVFINMLCHAGEDGIVDRHWRAISDETGVPTDRVRQAIAALESPDPETRTPTEAGRRIVRLSEHREWGWRIVNHAHYRNMRTTFERREYMRKYMQERRVNSCKQNVSTLANTDTDTDTDTKKHPQTPTGDLFRVQAAPEEPKAAKPWEPTACMLEIGKWFNRRPTTRWQKNELKAFKEICDGDDFPPEIHIVRAFYTANIIPDKDTRDTRRQDLVTLLNNWNGEIDKAKRFIVARRRVEPTFAMEVKL
jgi:hypothetical protein